MYGKDWDEDIMTKYSEKMAEKATMVVQKCIRDPSIASLSTMYQTPPQLQEIRETQFSRSISSDLVTVEEMKYNMVHKQCHNQMPNRFEEALI